MRLKDCKFSVEWSDLDQAWIGKCDKLPGLEHSDPILRQALSGIASQALQTIQDSNKEKRAE
jgi:hypothetical protein